MMQFGGADSYANGNPEIPDVAPIIRWASANHGTWNSAYGDQNSRYMYACSDLSGANVNNWRNPLSFSNGGYAQRCVVHFKKAGNDEFILQWDTAKMDPVAYPSGLTGGILAHIHYVQNGETTSVGSAYSEGHTSAPGGEAYLNANKTGSGTTPAIQSLEDGGSDGVNPSRLYGIVTNFLMPSGVTNTVQWDCPLGGGPSGHVNECQPSSTYADGMGHTDRVSICAGSSCGATVSTFESLVAHKITASLADTTLTTTALNPDANWFGVQATGANTSSVFVGARGGVTNATMSGFTTTHSGTAQYLLGGLTAGTYTVTVNSSPVSGSPFTVGANDSSIYFESTAGTVSVNGSVAACSITTTSLLGGTVGAGYSQPISTANCTAPLTWSIASGSLCAGLNFGSSTGATDTIGGTPTTAQTCSFTAQAVDAVLHTASQALSITIATGAVATASSIWAGAAISAGTIRH
jgi:hypothetical protein